MSLYKQLWLAIALLLTVAFGSSFVVSSLSAKSYLEEQLYIKNSDNANALALSLGQNCEDEMLLELTLAAQFDTGFYQYIQLVDPEGVLVLERRDDQPVTEAPLWFTQMLPLEVEPGVAQVSCGWTRLGTLSLESHVRFAYRQLWDSSKKLVTYFLFALVGSGLLGSLLLRVITQPLGAVVEQAEAIGDRRFVTTAEPSTLEFKTVVSSMNTLSGRIRGMLEQEAARLEQWRRDVQIDRVTGLLNRGPFFGLLNSARERDDTSSTGVITMIRIPDMNKLNQSLGRAVMDTLLVRLGQTLNQMTAEKEGWAAARLNGSDMAVLSPATDNATQVAQKIQDALLTVVSDLAMSNSIRLPGATTLYGPDEELSSLLSRMDDILLASENTGGSMMGESIGEVHLSHDDPTTDDDDERWKGILDAAFASRDFELAFFPVSDLEGHHLHDEAPVRLLKDGELLSAGQFLPWINRMDRGIQLDKMVVELALDHLAETESSVGVNLSPEATADPEFATWIENRLREKPTEAGRLWLEIPEAGAYQNLEGFRHLCQLLSPLNCRVGIEHVGHQLAKMGQLHDLGLDYVKIDTAFVRDIHTDESNQTLLRSLCTIVHSIGLMAIAEGVRTQEEWDMLRNLGIDGATGPAVSERR